MALVRYKTYVGSNRYKLRSPSFSGKGTFVKGLSVSLSEVVSAHVNVTCFDGGNGSVTVVASGGTPPYQYSLDPTFATYNTDGVFSNLSLVGPVDEGTDEYGGILISHRRFYVRDASGQIVSCVVDLKSPVELEWVLPDDIIHFATKTEIEDGFAVVYVPFVPYLTTTANVNIIIPTEIPEDNKYQLSSSSEETIINMRYYARSRSCGVTRDNYFKIKIIPSYFPNAITDFDGNWYDAVVIGNQVWLASNLRTTHYADGTPIPAGGSTASGTDPYYYDYSSSGIPLKDRGLLYNWPAVMNGSNSSTSNPSGVQGIAPTGWHVPSDAEWRQLTNYVGSVPEYILNNNSTYIAKALASQSYWNASTQNYTPGKDSSNNNKTMFGIVPAGGFNGSSYYNTAAGSTASFWSTKQHASVSDNAIVVYLYSYYVGVSIVGIKKHGGCSVRCVCDLSPMDFAAWYYDQYGSYNHQLPTE